MSEQIKETEIMIGNYLFASDQQIHRVSKFDDKTIWFEKTINRHGVFCWLTSKISECIPIPLTEDILLKCGFKIESFSFYMYKDFIVRKIRESDKQWRVIFRHKDLKDIEYLHDLQNLIRILTQTDLKVEV